MSFVEVDSLFGTEDVREGYKVLKEAYDGGSKGDAELLWRLSRTCHEMACRTNDKNKKKSLLLEGSHFADEAVASDESNVMALKWAAILTGQITDFLGTKEKIEIGAKFKEYLDKAIALGDNDFTIYHLRGRYAYSVSGLSWIERKIATTLFAAPPIATYDEALADFLTAYDLKNDWIENLLFLAKVYFEKKEKENAANYLRQALELTPVDDHERGLLKECSKLLSKC